MNTPASPLLSEMTVRQPLGLLHNYEQISLNTDHSVGKGEYQKRYGRMDGKISKQEKLRKCEEKYDIGGGEEGRGVMKCIIL